MVGTDKADRQVFSHAHNKRTFASCQGRTDIDEALLAALIESTKRPEIAVGKLAPPTRRLLRSRGALGRWRGLICVRLVRRDDWHGDHLELLRQVDGLVVRDAVAATKNGLMHPRIVRDGSRLGVGEIISQRGSPLLPLFVLVGLWQPF